MTMHVAMMLDGIAARIARMRAENSDQPGDYGADQRQKTRAGSSARLLRMISGQTESFVRETPVSTHPGRSPRACLSGSCV